MTCCCFLCPKSLSLLQVCLQNNGFFHINRNKNDRDLCAVWYKSVDNLSASVKQSHDVCWRLCQLRRRAITIILIIKLLPVHLNVHQTWL